MSIYWLTPKRASDQAEYILALAGMFPGSRSVSYIAKSGAIRETAKVHPETIRTHVFPYPVSAAQGEPEWMAERLRALSNVVDLRVVTNDRAGLRDGVTLYRNRWVWVETAYDQDHLKI